MSPAPQPIEQPRRRHTLPGGHRPYNPQTVFAQYMLRRGLRLQHVARTTGVHERLLSDYLARRKAPSRRSLGMLTRYCGMPSEQFIDGEGKFMLAPGFGPAVSEDKPNA